MSPTLLPSAPTCAASGDDVSLRDTFSLRLDGQPHELPRGTSLADLVTTLGHAPNEVGTAVNGLFVARTQRSACELQPGDAVVLFRPIVGG